MTAIRVRTMTMTFHLRDDEAACSDCDWTWKQPDSGPLVQSEGGRAAKKHAGDNGHEVMVRRVQFIRHEGLGA